MSGLRVPVDGSGCQAHGATNSLGGVPRMLVREKTRPVGSHECWSAKKLAQRGPSSGISAKKFARRTIKHPF